LSQSGLPSGSVSNTCLSVNGTLAVDAAAGNYLMENMEIIMHPGSRIRVMNGSNLEIRGSHIHGCTAMWAGIYLDQNSALIFTGNTIEDAEFALSLPAGVFGGTGTTIYLTGNTFAKNFIGIGQFAANPFVSLPSPFTAFHSNEFHCENLTLLPAYTGQPTTPGNISAAGVELRFLSGVVIGDGNTSHANKFHHMANGIILEGVTATVNSCKIYDIGAGSGYSLLKGYGIHAKASDLDLKGWGYSTQNPTFRNVPTGVYSNINNLTASDVTMIGVQTGFRVETGFERKISIFDNYIFCDNIGIDLWQNQQALSLNVKNNHIYVDELEPYDLSKGTGIAVNDDPKVLSSGIKNIHLNYIEAYGANFGISVNSASGYNLWKNGAYFQDASAKNGIRVDNGADCLLSCNTALGLSGGNLDANTGFRINATTGTVYACNYVNNMRTGLRFTGVCSSSPGQNTEVRGNTMFGNSRGFWMGPDAVFGSPGNPNVQLHQGNNWGGTFGDVTAIHEGLQSQLDYSLFEVHTSSLPYFPVGFNTPNIPSYAWFYMGSGTPATCDTLCPLPAPDEVTHDTIGDFGLDIARDSLEFAAFYAPVMKRDLKRLLYRILDDTPALLNQSADLQQFYTSESTSPTGLFTEIDKSTEQLLRADTPVVQHLVALYDDILAAKQLLDSLAEQSAGSPTFTTVQQDIAVKRPLQLLIDSLWNVADSLLAELSAARDSLSDEALVANAAISTSEIFDENEQAVNAVYLNSVLKGRNTLTGIEQAILEEIAEQCPALGGNAVYEARSLLAFDGVLRYYDDDGICEEAEQRGNATRSGISGSAIPFTVFPNPANEFVQVRRTDGMAEAWQVGHGCLRASPCARKCRCR
jgi:hypothetical protein